MLAKAGIHYAKINEKTDSHFRGNDSLANESFRLNSLILWCF